MISHAKYDKTLLLIGSSRLSALIYALLGNLSFSFASLGFTEFARRISAQWMNTFKAVVSLLATVLVIFLFQIKLPAMTWDLWFLLVSGLLGLCLGDFFMMKAMHDIGGSRMVMMFGLTPFLTGVGSWYFFGSQLNGMVWLGVVLMVLCVSMLSLERYKVSGAWHLRGVIFGLLAVLLDAAGLIITKNALSETHAHPLVVNLLRLLGALVGFVLMDRFVHKIHLKAEFLKLNVKDRWRVTLFGLLGTFVSLQFYLTAVSMGHLSVVSSVAGTGPLFTQIFESLKEKKWPHPLWFAAFLCMVGGFWCFTAQV
jgi:drug/metabolite transporter (DMT)-like permease